MKMMYRMYECRVGHGWPRAATQDVRDYAAQQGITEDEALKKGMQEQAVKFVKGGSEIYKEV